jgi:putative nucleotidyltransferase with HDIG domain
MHNVTVLANEFGQILGLDSRSLRILKTACEFHDIGKELIKDRSLLCKKNLTPEEFQIIKEHSVLGAEYLEKAGFDNEAALIVRHHHERWDGTGYPSGLKKEKIPFLSRIITIADAYDAMVTGRPYRKTIRSSLALKEIYQHAGTQFDPSLAMLFIEIQKEKNKAKDGVQCI